MRTDIGECEDEFLQESQRRENLVADAENPLERSLFLAADQFIVQRNTNQKSIIAGYHWFGDWGRDTMISRPDFVYVQEGSKMRRKFNRIRWISKYGNASQQISGWWRCTGVQYRWCNTVVLHCRIQILQSDIRPSVYFRKILPVLLDILDNHVTGTRYGIHQDDDGLFGQEKMEYNSPGWMPK